MKIVMGLLAVALVGAGCSDTTGEAEPAPTSPDPVITSATTLPPPSTAAAVATTVATTQAPTTETAEPPANAAPVFSLTQVAFGDAAFVQITNSGNGSGDIGGHWLCQRPVYFEIPAVELGPGESVWIAADGGDLQFVGAVVGVVDAKGRIGSLAPGSGEIALYSTNDFGNPESIVDYVEWGLPGHGRSSVAVEAGLWPAAAFVDIPDNTIGITAPAGGDSPADWSPDIGV